MRALSDFKMEGICVVHLVWAPLGIEPLRDFVSSYRRTPAGVDHRLIVIFNGFRREEDTRPYRALLDGLSHETLFVSPPTQDLPTYFAAARKFEADYFCFLNSYSVLLAAGWLEKMHRHVVREGVGVVGATGSYESYTSNFYRLAEPFPSRYSLRRLYHRISQRYKFSRVAANFDPFPNYHVRSNGFMLARRLMLGLRAGPLRTKTDCFKFESGKRNFTRQIIEMGLKPLVVGADGRAYEKEEWFESATFRSGGQRNLLISDNHTRLYETAAPEHQSVIREITWGEAAGRSDIEGQLA